MHTNYISLADRRPNGRRPYYRGGRRAPLRRPRPPPQDSQGEDKTEGTEGENVMVMFREKFLLDKDFT